MTNKDKHKLYGIIATIAFHAIAIVLLFTLCFKTPLPLPGEAGVEVNMGMYADALSQQDNTATSQQVEETPQPQVEETTTEEIEEEILSEDEETPAIEEENVEAPEEMVKEEAVEEKPVVNQRAMFQAPKNNRDALSEGDSIHKGVQGIPNGLKDIDRYEGNGGSGDGPAYDLGGRGAKSISSPSKNFSEEGKVVVDIWVDKDGRVQRTEIGKGTTVTDAGMRTSALQAAKNSIFNKDDKAADLQKGTITYTFIIRQ